MNIYFNFKKAKRLPNQLETCLEPEYSIHSICWELISELDLMHKWVFTVAGKCRWYKLKLHFGGHAYHIEEACQPMQLRG